VPSVVHVVATANFAGVERYVSDVARETAGRGWDVAVVGAHPEQMPVALGGTAAWLPGATAVQVLRSLHQVGRRDVCHAHMTVAEALTVIARPLHRAPVVATRHFAAPRGASHGGRVLSPWIARGLAREIAVSDYVASRTERRPDAVILNGVPPSPCLWRSSSRTVLVLQRLEPEKDTITALRAWKASRLAEEGWVMRVVGDGSERATLEAWVTSKEVEGVTFVGWVPSAQNELAGAGVLLAPGPGDSFGLAVVEAMAAGVPVAASAAGGHLETVGRIPDAAMFPPGGHGAAACVLRALLDDDLRLRLSNAARRAAQTKLTIARHVDRLLVTYEAARSEPRADASRSRRSTRSRNRFGRVEISESEHRSSPRLGQRREP
jgi:glycosyltransferase involved in cell wall biosynthesis